MPEAPASRRWLVALGALYAVAVAVYLVLAGRIALPLISPDEFTYGHLARSVADGDGLSWRGAGEPLRSALYVFTIVPAWLGDSTTDAYALAKSEGVLLICLAALPAWLAARRFVNPPTALAVAGLTIAGTWMTAAGSLLTENLAYPLATGALAATVVAVQRPGGRAGLLALALSVLAGWARLQCVALVAVLPLALLLTALAAPEPMRERLARSGRVLAVTGSLTLAGGLFVLLDPSSLGNYRGIVDARPSAGDVLAATGHQWVGLVAMAGFVPLIIVLAGSASRTSWRSPVLGPLLSVSWVTAVLLLAQSAWTITVFGTWHVQRYVLYVLPVLFLTAAVAIHEARLSRRRLLAATVLVAVLLLLAPAIRQVLEERAAWAISLRLDDLIGASTPVALALVAVLTGVILALVAGPLRSAGTVALVAGALTLVVFAVQDQAGWSWQTRLARAERTGFPKDLQWIDHAGNGDVARLIALSSPWRWQLTEFFNRDVTQVYGLPAVSPVAVRGPLCRWNPDASGRISFSGPCGPVPHQYFSDEEQVRLTLYDQRIEARTAVGSRVVSVPDAPRLRSLLFVPCGPPTPAVEFAGRGRIAIAPGRCVNALQAQLWLDTPAVLAITFRGDGVDHIVQGPKRSWTLAPNVATTIRIPVAAGASDTQLQLDWQGPTPRLARAVLLQGSRRTDLL